MRGRAQLPRGLLASRSEELYPVLFFLASELEKFPGRSCKIHGPILRHNDIILNAYSAQALQIHAGLDCENHALLDHEFFAASDTRHLVNVETQPVACAVGEVLRKSM